ncbi:sensor histidine kinase [Kosmotoga pacifica]|uniref:histidine kinase n=1 Tax=Kosmotoga pacifica TaxID=1330330 RepID=A0A0G2ZED7_9BACT|nr:HAMP domain-containing sensor histidine kinase [Kosmotoga pacifica]AKI97929.1 hypothetical protein IX53_08965 [Kosmotoga pacifica]
MYSKSKNILFISLVSILTSLVVVTMSYLLVRSIVINTARRNAVMILREMERVKLHELPPGIFRRIPTSVFLLQNRRVEVLYDALDISNKLDFSQLKDKSFINVAGETMFTAVINTPKGVVAFIQPGENMLNILKKTAFAFFWVWLVSTGIILASAYANYRRTVKSFRELIEKAKEISTKMEGFLPEKGLDSNTARFISALNEMIKRLRASIEEEKRFAANAAHELKTPLANIIGYTSMLLRWGLKDEAVAEKSLSAINVTAKKLNELVSKLLLLSSPMTSLKHERTNVCNFVKAVLNEYKSLFPAYQFQIECRENPVFDLPKEALEIVVKVFLDNAVKYSPENGVISVVVESNRLGVSSMGPEILEEYHDKIFEPFFRLETDREGHGLGLAIAKNVASRFSWKLSVESKEGMNTFWVIFN